MTPSHPVEDDSVVLAPSQHCWVPQPFHQWAPVAAPWTGHTYGTCARHFTVALPRLIEVLEWHLPTAPAADSSCWIMGVSGITVGGVRVMVGMLEFGAEAAYQHVKIISVF